MGRWTQKWSRTLPALAVCAVATTAHAGDSEGTAPTFMLDLTAGYSVYKSEMVQSNDTGFTTRYGFAVNGGANHQIGMLLARESTTIAFKNTASTIAVSWQDLDLRYRWAWFYAGLVVSSSSWTVTSPPRIAAKIDPAGVGEDYIDLLASGYGANLGLTVPVGKRNALITDITYVTTAAAQQKAAGPSGTAAAQAAAARVSTVGPRMEIDLGAAIGLTRSLLDATCGFKYRTYSVSVDGTASKELLNTTYVGLRANWTF